MGGFLSFVKKEALHIVRDPRTMLIVLLMPVVQVLLFGFAMNTEVTDIEVAVVAPHPTEAVRRAVERIAANPYFTFRGCIAATEIDRTLRRGDADAVVVFAEDYDRRTEALKQGLAAEPAVQLVFDASNTNTASAGAGYLTSVLLSGAPGVSAAGTRLLFNPQMKSSYNFVPGIMGMIFILICAMMTSVSIVREKETGTMEVLLVSPMRPIYIILAKAVPYLALSAVNLATIILVAVYILQVPVAGSLFWLSVISLLFVITALALGLLISTLVKTQVAAMLASGMVLMMPTTLLSGMMFPIESMPGVLQGLSAVIPARWYIEAVKKVMIEGLGITYALKEVAILSAMAVVLVVVSLKKFKYRLE